LARYSDGHAYCFSTGCDNYEHGDGETEYTPRKPMNTSLMQGHIVALKKRGITEETCNLFGYSRVNSESKGVLQVANYYHPKTRELCGQKVRDKDKNFWVEGSLNDALFGWQLWAMGGRKIVITEGEIDALTVSQAQGNKYPVVSLPNGCGSAKKAILANLEYLKKFDEVILMFDMDEPGRAATEIAAKLLGPRARIAELPRKDANATFLELGIEPIIKAIWSAQARRPAGLYTGAEVLEMGDTAIEAGLSFPWETLTGATYGKRPHEMILVGAGTGCGKTDWMKEDIAHNISAHGAKCMTIFLEEPNLPLTMATVAGKIDGVLYHVPGTAYDREKYEATKRLVAEHLLLFKVEDSVEPEDVLELIREAVEGYGVTHVYLDHVTYLLDSSGEGDLSATKQLMRSLNDLNKALPFTLYYIAHLRKKPGGGTSHEEGGRITLDDFAGGKAITQYANFAFGLERSQQDPDEKNYTTLRVLKDRYTGQSTGLTINLEYDTTTGKKNERPDFGESDSNY
jgi:twinkle protein